MKENEISIRFKYLHVTADRTKLPLFITFKQGRHIDVNLPHQVWKQHKKKLVQILNEWFTELKLISITKNGREYQVQSKDTSR